MDYSERFASIFDGLQQQYPGVAALPPHLALQAATGRPTTPNAVRVAITRGTFPLPFICVGNRRSVLLVAIAAALCGDAPCDDEALKAASPGTSPGRPRKTAAGVRHG